MSDRESFEEAAARLGYNLAMAEHETGEYHYAVTQGAWWIWQEALEYARVQVVEQGVEPVGYVRPHQLEALRSGKACGITMEDKPDAHNRVTIPLYTHPQPAQSWKEVEPVAWECSGEPGLYSNITRSKGEADHHRKIGRTVRPLVYGDTHPQPPKSKEE